MTYLHKHNYYLNLTNKLKNKLQVGNKSDVQTLDITSSQADGK